MLRAVHRVGGVVTGAAAADSGAGAGGTGEHRTGEREPTLPEPVRQRVIGLAAGALSNLADDQIPAPLRRIARFAPQRRARLAGAIVATQLAADPVFRQRIANLVVTAAGDIGAVVRDGGSPAAADPVDVAALAYLSRPTGWDELVSAASEAVSAEVESAAVAQRIEDARLRAERAEAERDSARQEHEHVRTQLKALREEVGGLREELRAAAKSARDAERRERKANEMLATEKGRVTRERADHDAELRRLRARLSEVEGALATSRQSSRDVRAVDEARIWLLLETIGQAAQGLRRELAVEPAQRLPADFVAEAAAETPQAAAAQARALAADDPARLDQLLVLPKAHLLVDGYNVTKTGFGDLSLEQQRTRLVGALGGIAAQSGAEVTVVFDGAERVVGLPPAPRGVRVLFSRKGQTADELIRQLVRAEPAGRPVIVVSSDREVADGVRRHGAYPLGAEALLRRLARG